MDKSKSKGSNKKQTPKTENNHHSHPNRPNSNLRPSSHQNNRFDSQRHVSLNTINSLLEKTPEEIILNLLNPKFGLNNYLDSTTMGDELIYKFTSLIQKAFDCNSLLTKLNELMNKILESNFFMKHLYESLNKPLPITHTFNLKLINSALKICSVFIYLNPYSASKLGPFKDRLELLIMNRIKTQGLIESFQELVRLDEEAFKKIERDKFKTFKNIDVSNLEPPEDFTQMNVVPKLNDILDDQTPFLRKNLTNGAYKNVHHYLDVQFRLLREDFMQPLRQGVCSFRKIISSTNAVNKKSGELGKEVMRQINKIDYLNIYFGVYMDDCVTSNNGIVYSMKLNSQKIKSINWESSKRLMFGSLVCFSSDYFKNDCIIGVICDSKMLEKHGCVYVRFNYDVVDVDKNNLPMINTPYIMLETSAYFESYKHVLQALVSFQRESELHFPFKENLIYCKNAAIPMPTYLKSACIDFRPLVDDKMKKDNVDRKTGFTKFTFSNSVKYAEKCYLTNEASWPNAKQMRLDESQYEAVKLALSSKLALIQGPPGTGKTYLGVKIMKLLLHNKHSWWNKPGERHKPILMICYTNHALDQFLEYCISECNLNQGVVRVGGRSKTESLAPFLLSNIKKNLRDERKIDGNIRFRIIDEISNFASLKSKIDNLNQTIHMLLNGHGVLKLEVLEKFISQAHLRQIKQFGSPKFEFYDLSFEFNLLEWLGLFDLDRQEFKIENVFADMRINDEEDDFENKEEFNDDDSLNCERMLEDDFEGVKNLKHSPSSYTSTDLIDESEIFKMISFFRRISGFRDSEWTEIKRRNKKENQNEIKIRQFLQNNLPLSNKPNLSQTQIQILENIQTNIWRLDFKDRFTLYLTWIEKFINDKQIELERLSNAFNRSASALQELRLQEDRSIMQDALIIAMTTTGSSRYHSVLKDIGPRIVIVEEAAEVFEAHIVSSLSKHCEHLILIGDHVQLRPNPAVYRLATEYSLDVSLFERLINNDIKKVMLTSQHRMRPEISVLMKHFYDKPIENHSSVNSFPDVIGLKKNIYFINHKQLEKSQSDDTSKLNLYEADYLSKFCLYLTKQNYCQTKITVLTMYLGQMMEIRKILKKLNLINVKVSTVDNYQGEENDIVLLSLVRSNLSSKIGFLNVHNRVCVALSRAKHGFFTIGNFDFISEAEKGDKWSSIIETLKQIDSIGLSLTLTCGVHPENDIDVKEPKDFDLRPDGGCLLPCVFRLNCGHVCAQKCHWNFDQEHAKYICQKTCGKTMDKCGHICQQKCSHENECFKCSVRVEKVIDECGHRINIRCDTGPQRINCEQPCKKILNCGHVCTKKCQVLNCGECETQIDAKSTCKHEIPIKVKCSTQIWSYQNTCSENCNEQLECGHVCKSNCGKCLGGYIHSNCAEKCERQLVCGHICQITCARQCLPCQKKCENKCAHSKCARKCSDPCSQCMEKCKNKCEHSKCSKLCHELCDREPCDKACKKKLKCGHLCIGICGEPCPSLCRVCNKKKVTEIFFGNEDDPDAKFILLQDCNHIVESTGMDYWIKSKYEFQDSSSSIIQLPECPKCKRTIRLNFRYSNIIKKQIKAIEGVKLKQFGDSKLNYSNIRELFKEVDKFIAAKDNRLFDCNQDSFDFEFTDSIHFELTNVLRGNISFNECAAYTNSWNIYKMLKSIQSSVDDKLEDKKEHQIEHVNFEIEKLQNRLILQDKTEFKLCLIREGQRMNDILSEIERVSSIVDFYKFENTAKKTTNLQDPLKVAKLLQKIKSCLIERINKFDSRIKADIQNEFKELVTLLKTEVTKEEKVMIVKAMGLSQGHWFKCKNGHVYCIDACGGAMEMAKCPDCKENIGGKNHRLEQDNLLASEMDGAQIPAWPGTLH